MLSGKVWVGPNILLNALDYIVTLNVRVQLLQKLTCNLQLINTSL